MVEYSNLKQMLFCQRDGFATGSLVTLSPLAGSDLSHKLWTGAVLKQRKEAESDNTRLKSSVNNVLTNVSQKRMVVLLTTASVLPTRSRASRSHIEFNYIIGKRSFAMMDASSFCQTKTVLV